MKNNGIIFLINSMSDGGAEKVMKLLIEELHMDKIKIDLVCLEKNTAYKLDKNIKVTYLTNLDKNTSGIQKLFFLPILAFKLSQYIKRNQIKIVQSHLFRANYVNIFSKFFRSKHKVQVVNHSVISRYKKEKIIGKVNLFLIRLLYPFADIIISVSYIVQRDMQKLFDFKNELKVINNMFDIKKIQKLSNELVENFEFRKDKKYLISVGRLIKLKRSKDLLIALSRLDDLIELIFIGDGEEKEMLIKLSVELNVSNRVHFIGWVDNPYKYIKSSDILVSTSESESFGNVLVEGMICKTVVISTKSGGPEEIIENKKDGVLIEIGDIDALINNIILLLNNDTLKKQYIFNSQMKVKLFDIANVIKEYKKVLNIE